MIYCLITVRPTTIILFSSSLSNTSNSIILTKKYRKTTWFIQEKVKTETIMETNYVLNQNIMKYIKNKEQKNSNIIKEPNILKEFNFNIEWVFDIE